MPDYGDRAAFFERTVSGRKVGIKIRNLTKVSSRRIWLPSSFQPQLKVELACRCVKFISKCLNSPNYVVSHVAKQGVYFQRLYSPIGRNAHHCVTMVDASLSDIASNTRKLSQAWYARHDTWLTESVRGKLKLTSELYCALSIITLN